LYQISIEGMVEIITIIIILIIITIIIISFTVSRPFSSKLNQGYRRLFRNSIRYRQSTFSNIFVTLLKAAVYPWKSWSEILVLGCPFSHQPTRIREETLESGNLFSDS